MQNLRQNWLYEKEFIFVFIDCLHLIDLDNWKRIKYVYFSILELYFLKTFFFNKRTLAFLILFLKYNFFKLKRKK